MTSSLRTAGAFGACVAAVAAEGPTGRAVCSRRIFAQHRTMVVAALATITWLSRLFRAVLSIIVRTGVLSAEVPRRTTDRVASPARFAAPRTRWGDPVGGKWLVVGGAWSVGG
jgi:hypothetical protein